MDFIEKLLTLVLILIPFVMFFKWLNKKTNQLTNKEQNEKEERFNRENIKYEFHLKHMSGYPYGSFSDYFQIKNDNTISISSYNREDPYNRISRKIPLENILRIEAKTEEEISKDITIPRILVGGIFALAKPKVTEVKKHYLYLSYIDSGVQIDCLFEGYPNENLGELTSIVNQIRIENNMG